MSTLKVIIHTENPHDHQKVRKGKLDCVMTVLSRRFCEIADLSKIEEMDRPCLYLLVDEGRKAYIGQTTSFRVRVKDHLGKKRWWTRAYVFVSGSNQYDQASITYLEYLAIREGLVTGSYDLSENGQKPTKPILQEGDSSDYDEIFEEIKFFLEYERCFVFSKREEKAKAPLQKEITFSIESTASKSVTEAVSSEPIEPKPAAKTFSIEAVVPRSTDKTVLPAPVTPQPVVKTFSLDTSVSRPVANQPPLFFLKHTKQTCVARGYPLNDGTKSFVVLKGSEISVKESNDKGGQARVEMLKKCTLYGNEKYVLNEDFVFDFPSGASSACLGRNSNGYVEWKTEAGVTLKSYLENLKQTHP
jgi:GIY-YIG catalytic domain protein